MFFPGLALYEADDRFGLNAQAQKYVDAASARIQLAGEALDKYAPNGGFWEGQSYYAARLQGEVYFIYAWKVATGEDLFEARKNLRHAARYWIYGLRPDGTSSREGDVTCAPSGCARNRFIAEILADRYQDGYAQWYAHFKGALSDAGNPFTDLPFDWNDIVFYNPDLPALSPQTLPLHAVFDIGRIVIRTGWNIGPQSPDTYVNYEIHDWPTGHTNYDVNSFTLWRKGSLAIDSGRYRGSGSISANHERNYALRTIAHNTMTIYKPGEDFATFSNDGGQEFIWRETNRPRLPFLHTDVIGDPSFMNDLEDGTRFDTATLEQFAAGDGFYYIRGNATDAYHSTGFHAPNDGAEAKISNFTREFVLLTDTDAPIAIVYDRVHSLDAGYTKKWLLHSINEPLVNGDVTGSPVPGHITTHDGDQVVLTHNQGKLFSSTLLPVQPVIRKVGGPGFEFWTDDPARNWPWRMDIADNEVGAWRVEVSPSTSQADDTFLHVLSLADSTATSVPAAALLETPARYGAYVSDQVVFFSKSGEAIRDGESYSIPASTEVVTHVITNLAEDEYDVRQGGCKIAKRSSRTNKTF